MGTEVETVKLTDRERIVAEHAADLAVKKMTENFYREVGRSFVNRWLIIIGAAVVAYSAGKGWIPAWLKN